MFLFLLLPIYNLCLLISGDLSDAIILFNSLFSCNIFNFLTNSKNSVLSPKSLCIEF